MSSPLKYNCWGEEIDVYFAGLEGENAHDLYLVTVEDRYPEFFCDVCIRLAAGPPFNPHDGFVKNYSENTGLDKWLEANGIATPTGVSVRSGYVQVPLYTFNIEKVREHLYTEEK